MARHAVAFGEGGRSTTPARRNNLGSFDSLYCKGHGVTVMAHIVFVQDR